MRPQHADELFALLEVEVVKMFAVLQIVEDMVHYFAMVELLLVLMFLVVQLKKKEKCYITFKKIE